MCTDQVKDPEVIVRAVSHSINCSYIWTDKSVFYNSYFCIHKIFYLRIQQHCSACIFHWWRDLEEACCTYFHWQLHIKSRNNILWSFSGAQYLCTWTYTQFRIGLSGRRYMFLCCCTCNQRTGCSLSLISSVHLDLCPQVKIGSDCGG